MKTGSEAFEEVNRAPGHHNRRVAYYETGGNRWHLKQSCPHLHNHDHETTPGHALEIGGLRACPRCVPNGVLARLRGLVDE